LIYFFKAFFSSMNLWLQIKAPIFGIILKQFVIFLHASSNWHIVSNHERSDLMLQQKVGVQFDLNIDS
jgi:hypothetical protein